MNPTREILSVGCASATSGAARTPKVRTIASPIRCISTSVGMAGGSLTDDW
jgi:hypothetical protein